MHHTLIVASPIHAVRVFTTNLYSCGWGEHGRLGLGDEEGRFLPTIVNFPEPFHPIEISAGEQHSLASSCLPGMCYAWGSNSFGQCASNSSLNAESCLIPIKVPLPEGFTIIKVAAGGRHSAGISACGKVVTWGWGEEGKY
jgi:alpha-tubulin suppressor-like RCC1 family protein